MPWTDHTRFWVSEGEEVEVDTGPQRARARSGVMNARSWAVGMRAAMFSGVFSAGRPVEVMRRISGNDEGGCEETTYRVPFDM